MLKYKSLLYLEVCLVCVNGKTNVTAITIYDDVISRITSVTVQPLGNLICMKTNESYQAITT